MGMAAGLSIAYIKILSLAALIMACIWVTAKVWLAYYQKNIAQPNDQGGDGTTDPNSGGGD
jgi:uncharacterized BrkB/YihY/UPF0761 family membrane protein